MGFTKRSIFVVVESETLAAKLRFLSVRFLILAGGVVRGVVG